MSFSGGPLTEELQFSVCLDVFTDPVRTPSGHKNSWTETLKQAADHEISNHCENKKPEVECDFCEDRKLKALKSCLVCQSSICETHLEPHLKVAGLKKHKLMDPVRNLENYICQKHERPLELFCRDDQACVCLFCTEGVHQNHNTVPIEEESKKKKTQLMKTQKDIQQMIQDRFKKIQDIKHPAEARRRVYTEVLELMEKQENEQIKELEQEITELKRRNTELKELSHTQDHLQLIQIHSSLQSSRTSRPSRSRPEVSIKTLRAALTKLKDSINEKLKQSELKWMQEYAVDVTLDPHTAHPELILSDDGTQVRCGHIWQKLPDNLERFNRYLSVMGKEGFSLGRFYFEVQVKGKTDWTLGVARESIDRKGEITVSPGTGCWTVALVNGSEYSARADPPVLLSLRMKPRRVGVFVDYEEGLVSFYDVESSSQIYSFTGQSFTHKLYPHFSPGFNREGKNSTPLTITPVKYNH